MKRENQMVATQNAMKDETMTLRRLLESKAISCLQMSEQGKGLELNVEDIGLKLFIAYLGRRVVAVVNGEQKIFKMDTRLQTYYAACDWIEEKFRQFVK